MSRVAGSGSVPAKSTWMQHVPPKSAYLSIDANTDHPGPLVENLTLPWFGDLIHGQSHVLHQILWRGRIADDGPVYLFELTFEDDNFDGIWGPNAYACHLAHGGVGFHRWIYGQPWELPMDQRGMHIADMVQCILWFLEIPDPFLGPLL